MNHALVPYPMTPRDEPEPPDLSEAVPCFCGSLPDLDDNGKGPESSCWLVCPSCGHQGPKRGYVPIAIERWNASVIEEGERIKAEGVAQVAENNAEWMTTAVNAIRLMASGPLTFTAEDLRAFLPAPKSPNAWGAAFSVAAKQGLIEACGYTVNKLASAHGRVVRVWKGKR